MSVKKTSFISSTTSNESEALKEFHEAERTKRSAEKARLEYLLERHPESWMQKRPSPRRQPQKQQQKNSSQQEEGAMSPWRHDHHGTAVAENKNKKHPTRRRSLEQLSIGEVVQIKLHRAKQKREWRNRNKDRVRGYNAKYRAKQYYMGRVRKRKGEEA